MILSAGDIPYHESHGYGTLTDGGLAGKVIRVTNLGNNGPGSFRSACLDSGSRLVVFEVGGVINLNDSAIIVTNPYLTVAGQTAPDPGITLIKGNLNISTHDVVIQHVAVRPGDATIETDAISTGGENADVHHVVFDHCSATWATDENLSLINTSDNHDITLYKCLIAEGLNFNDHSCGSLIYGGISNLSIIGCIYAHNVRRSPRINNNTGFVLANNIFYNWSVFSDDKGDYTNCVHLRLARGTIAGNLALGGNDTRDYGSGLYFVRGHDGIYTGDAYFENNMLRHADGHSVIKEHDELIRRLEHKPLWPEGFILKSVRESVDDVLRTAGARAGNRDAIDERIVKSVIYLTGDIIDRQSDVEGYQDYTMTTREHIVPGNPEDRRKWLDSLSAAIDTDDSLDTSPLIPVLDATDIREQQVSVTSIPGLLNSPNPFERFTVIKFNLPAANRVTLKIYDLTGNEIVTLLCSYQPAGEYELNWIPDGLPGGIYLCRLQAGDNAVSRILIKQN
ncbi:MAG: T9SS type A sorting domain-containing protein [Bacteroidales bacterium]|nr:T9SS type A sorting domain-containing protein [Bacteroidales bacterium]